MSEHLYHVGQKLAWRGNEKAEIVALIPLDSPFAPDPSVAHYTVLFQGRERVTVSQSALMRQGRAA